MELDGPYWYLVYSKPQQEERARSHLARQGYEVFLPHIHIQQRNNGRTKQRVTALFPRYLFIHLDLANEDWGPIRSTLGVSNLVRFGQSPARVPTPLVERLIASADADGIVADHRPAPLMPGERVRVEEGLLAGYEGIVQSCDGGERVRVLLDLVSRHTRATLRADQVGRIA